MRSDVERRTDEIDIENRTQPQEGTLVNTPAGALLPPMMQQEYGEEAVQLRGDQQKVARFSMRTIYLINEALNQAMFQRPQEHPTTIDASESSERDESRSKGLLAAAQDRGDGAPLEETGSVLQDIGENVAAAEASPMVPEELLKAEENAHQQTRANLARLEDWCKRLEVENAELQTQVEGVGRENAIIQRQLHDAEDESTGFQKRLSDSQHQIHELTSSNEIYISTTEELQNQVAGLNADLSWYSQLGTEFFVRLQNAEKFLRPCDGVFDEYQRLMGDAAHYFTKLGPREPDTDSLGEERFVEVVEENHNEEQENAPESKGVPMLGKHKVTWDHTLANGGDTMQADTFQVNEMDSTLEDDDAPYPGHPMRPGTKSRPPISVFENGSADTREGSSSSLFENLGQKLGHAPSPAAPAFPISFDFLGSSFNCGEKWETPAVQQPSWKPIHEPAKEPAHNQKASNTSARRRHGKGGTERSRGCSGRGTNLR